MKSNLQIKKNHFLLVVFLCLFSGALRAQTLKGNVTDAKTGEALIGATVHIANTNLKLNTSVKLDGSYTFKNVPAGTYKLQVKYVGYKTTKEYAVDVSAGNTAVLNVAMVDNATALNEVTITEHASKETDRFARNEEKNSKNTINVVSAATIAISPDVLVSNVLSRVSGISVDRGGNGDAQHAIIRGLDKQYNTTLINGVKIPSPDNTNRFVPLDIFPAELVERIEVFKTLTPDMESDATGGVINLVMKTAPDKLRVEGYFGTGYSQLFFDRNFYSFTNSTVNSKAPTEYLGLQGIASLNDFPYQNLLTKSQIAQPNLDASLTIGDRFLNNKLGVVFAGTFRNDYEGRNSFQLVQSHTVGPAPDANGQDVETLFQDGLNRQYSSQVSRLGVMSSLDFKINKSNSINLFATYLQLNEYRVRNTQDLVYGGYSYQGYRYTYEIDNLTETRSDLQNIFNATLKGKHKIGGGFSVDWTLAASQATHKIPDFAEFQTHNQTSPSANSPQVPTPGDPNSSTTVAQSVNYGPTDVGDESRNWNHNTDKDLAGYVNLNEQTRVFGRNVIFSAGGMYRHKTRDNFVDAYTLSHTSDPGDIYNNEKYVSIPASTFYFPSNIAAMGSAQGSAGVYNFTENIWALYGKIDYQLSSRLDLVFGLRGENTHQDYNSNLGVQFAGKSASISYVDYLASANLKYTLTEQNAQAIRASFYQSNLRPAFADLIPYSDNTSEIYNVRGNPFLQHTTVDNFDLRYEIFPGVFDELLAGVFFKYLINPIEQQFVNVTGSSLTLEPVNLGNAHNFGAEFSGKKFFGDIGFAANYTYTHSAVTSIKRIDVINNSEPIYRSQTRPLQGQAANIGNFSVLYKNTKNGLDAQLALSYIGERITTVSEYFGLDTYEKPTVNLDFSAQKQFNKHWIIFVKANNLLNTPFQLIVKQNNTYNYSGVLKYPHQESPNYTTVQYDQYYARYNLGVRFNY
jgi:TonB-dependent receptor